MRGRPNIINDIVEIVTRLDQLPEVQERGMAILEESSEGPGKDGEAQPSKLLMQEHIRRSPPHVLSLKSVSLISLLFFSFGIMIYIVYSL